MSAIASLGPIEAAAAGTHHSLMLCGHTHVPRVVRLRDGRMIVNPGSVGCPAADDDQPLNHVVQSGTPDACYALIERRAEDWLVDIRHVPCDHQQMANLAARNGHAEWAEALAMGWIR